MQEAYDLLMQRFPKLALLLPHFDFQEERTEKKLQFSSSLDVDLVYFYGLGKGEGYLHFKKWLEEDPKRRLFIIEKDLEKISSFLHEKIAFSFLSDLQVFLGIEGDEEVWIQSFPSGSIEVVALEEDEIFFRWKEALLRKAFLSWAGHIDRLYGHQLLENFLKNLDHLPFSFYANSLEKKFPKVPAILCGAGPSLEKATVFLKEMEDQALIFAGGSTIAALTQRGITPHFAMAIDPNPEEYERLKNSSGFEIPFLFSTRVTPDLFQTTNGPFLYMRSGVGGVVELWMEEALGLNEELISKDLTMESLSVTSILLAWAQFLGCDPIFLAGVDLAYVSDERYVSGVELRKNPFHAAEMGVDRKMLKKKSCGKEVNTALRWVMESSSFSDFAKKHPEQRFYHLNDEGLGFEEISYCDLKRAKILCSSEKKDLRKSVIDEVLRAKMPKDTQKILQQKKKELFLSLLRVIDSLKILAQEKKGSIHLAEEDLKEEIAYNILFFDMKEVLQNQARLEGKEGLDWKRFLEIAKKSADLFSKDAVFMEFISQSTDANS